MAVLLIVRSIDAIDEVQLAVLDAIEQDMSAVLSDHVSHPEFWPSPTIRSLKIPKYSHHISLCHMDFQNFGSLHDLHSLPKTTLQGGRICWAGEEERRRCCVCAHDRAHYGLRLEHGQDDINYRRAC